VAATDILSTEEAKQSINVADIGDHATELARRISAVSQAIDSYCGPVVAREVTEIHDGGSRWIWPRQAPVLTVTSLTEFNGSAPQSLIDEGAFATVGTAYGYAVVDDGYRIERRTTGHASTFINRAGSVELVYQAGRFADTASVSAKFKEAAGDILRRVWKREGSAWAYSPTWSANTDEAAAVVGSEFFRAVEPMINEWLWDERRLPAIA
jgi:hypothetical protein